MSADDHIAQGHIAQGPGYEFEFGGLCLIQGWGQIDGHECYFRARGAGWGVEVFAQDSGVTEANYEHVHVPPLFVYEERRHTWPDAGYMTSDECRQHIETAVTAFRLRNDRRRDFLRLLRARRQHLLVILGQRTWRVTTGWAFFISMERPHVITLTARRIVNGGDLWIGPLWRGRLRRRSEGQAV